MQLRNELTGEIVAAWYLGKADDGKRIYRRQNGWLPCDSRGEPLDEALVERDADGNYLVGDPPDWLLPPTERDEDDDPFSR